MLEAKCRNADDPDLWDIDNLPASIPHYPNRPSDAAKALCRGCPVIRDCANWAVRVGVTGLVAAGAVIPVHPTRAAVARAEIHLRLDRKLPHQYRRQLPTGRNRNAQA
ncbi:WhiB family transcriptional regulator [Nocardia sp. NPDC055165]